jgi:hypothetical protein
MKTTPHLKEIKRIASRMCRDDGQSSGLMKIYAASILVTAKEALEEKPLGHYSPK